MIVAKRLSLSKLPLAQQMTYRAEVGHENVWTAARPCSHMERRIDANFMQCSKPPDRLRSVPPKEITGSSSLPVSIHLPTSMRVEIRQPTGLRISRLIIGKCCVCSTAKVDQIASQFA